MGRPRLAPTRLRIDRTRLQRSGRGSRLVWRLIPLVAALLALPALASDVPTYFLVALKTREQLAQSGGAGARVAKLLRQYNDAYLAGAVGPDVCALAVATERDTHRASPRTVVMEMLEQAQKGRTARERDRNTAFTLGWITHCATDWVMEDLMAQFEDPLDWFGDRRFLLERVESVHVFEMASDADKKALRSNVLNPSAFPVPLIDATFGALPEEPTTEEEPWGEGPGGAKSGANSKRQLGPDIQRSARLAQARDKGYIQNSKNLKPSAFPREHILPPMRDEYRELMEPLAINDVRVDQAGADSKLVVKYTINDFRIYQIYLRKWDKLLPKAISDSCAYLREYADRAPAGGGRGGEVPNLRLPSRPLVTPHQTAYPGDPLIDRMLGHLSIMTADGQDLSPWPKEGEWVEVPSRSQWEASHQKSEPWPGPKDPSHKWTEEESWPHHYRGEGEFTIPFDDKGAGGVSINLSLAFADEKKQLYGWPAEGNVIEANWSWTKAPPTDLMFVIDKSSKLGQTLQKLQEGFFEVTGQLKETSPEARVGVVTYAPAPGVAVSSKAAPPQVDLDLTSDMGAAQNAIKRITTVEPDRAAPAGAAQPRPILAALSKALQQKWTGRFKLVVLVADADTTPERSGILTANQVAWTALKLDPVDVHTVLVGPTADPKSPSAQPFLNLSALCRGQVSAARQPEEIVDRVNDAIRGGIENCFRPPVDTSRLPSLPSGTITGGGGGGVGGGGGGSPAPVQTAAPVAPRPSGARVAAIVALILCVILIAVVAVVLAARARPTAPEAFLAPTAPGAEPVPLRRRTVVLGRGEQATVRLADEQASSAHASISWSAAGYTITDHGSTNGTFVNGQRISAPTLLKVGDVIRIGRTELRFTGPSS